MIRAMHIITPDLLAQHDFKIPDYIASSVQAIDFEVLAQRGIRYVLVDVDNTLVSFGGSRLQVGAVRHLREARRQGMFKTLVLVTNSWRNLSGITAALQPTRVFQPHGLLFKPRKAYYLNVLHTLDCQPQEAVMIGDRLVQDIWGARRAGLTTILVKPLGRDLWLDRLLATRWHEKRLLRRYLPHHPEHWF